MTIRLITFDLDHTLWDPHTTLIAAEQAMYQWLCQQVPQFASLYSYEALVEYRINLAKSRPQLAWQVSEMRKQVLRLVLLQSGVSETQIASLVEQAFAVFYKKRSELTLFAGAEAVLKKLSSDYTLIALTNGNADLKLVGIDHWFSAYFNAEMVGEPKPKPSMFAAALAQAKVEPYEAVHVGDSIKMDVLAAKALGMKTVWVNYLNQDWPEEHPQPDAIITDIQQLDEQIAKLQQE